MRLIYYLKSNLKVMKSTLLSQILYYMLFPLVMAGVFTLTETMGKNTEIKLKETTIQVIDNDNTEMSKEVLNLLKGEGMDEIISVDEDGKNKLIIEKGYEDNILEGKEGKIALKVEDGKNVQTLETLKVVLDKYHQNLYIAVNGGENIKENNIPVVKEEILENDVKENTFKRSITGMIGFIIIMLIYNLIVAQHMEVGINLGKKIKSLPVKKNTLYFYEVIGTIVQTGIILGAYIFLFRLTGIAFTGNLTHIIELIFITSLFVTGVGMCISYLFGKKLSKLAANLFLLSFIAGAETFGGIGKGIGIVSMTEPIDKLFINYNSFGNILGCEKLVAIVVIVSIALILIGGIRDNFRKEIV